MVVLMAVVFESEVPAMYGVFWGCVVCCSRGWVDDWGYLWRGEEGCRFEIFWDMTLDGIKVF